MKEGPDIARIASLVGDPARANMLSALMDGGALTASELALEAGVTAADGEFASGQADRGRPAVAVARRAGIAITRWPVPQVAAMLEAIMGVAAAVGPQRTRPGRATRPCARRASATIISPAIGRWPCSTAFWRAACCVATATRSGSADRRRPFFAAVGIDIAGAAGQRRPVCRACLDWSVRRSHLAGALGAAILTRSSPRNGRGASRRAARSSSRRKARCAFAKTFLPAG